MAATVPPVAPPTPQEVSRKLSMSVQSRPVKAQTSTSTLTPSPITLTAPHQHNQHHQVSGTESDSDSFLSPDHSPLTSHGPNPNQHQQALGHVHYPGGGGGGTTISLAASSSTKPLSSIAERRSGSGDESEEDEYEEHEGEGDEGARQGYETPRRVAGDSIIKTGYLWKKGERRKTWKKRWFVLRPSQLAFYKSSAEYQLLRLLDLADVHCCTPVSLKRHAHAFGLVSPERTYYLYASSEEEMREWVAAVNQAREALVGTETQNSSVATPPIPIPGGGASGSRGHGPSAVSATTSSGLTPSPPSARHPHPVTSESDSEDGGHAGSYNAPTAIFGTSPLKNMHAPKDPSKQVISGYLMKCRSKRRGWRKRWFVLTGEKLMYMANHMDSKRQRVIDLSQILDALEYDIANDHRHHSHHSHANITSAVTASSPPRHSHAHAGHGQQSSPNLASHTQTQTSAHPSTDDVDGTSRELHTFKIVTTKRTLLLSAPSEEEEIQWLSAVRALIARRAGATGTPGGDHTHGQSASGHTSGSGSGPGSKVSTNSANVNTTTGNTSAAAGASSTSPSATRRRSASGNSASALMGGISGMVGLMAGSVAGGGGDRGDRGERDGHSHS